MDREYVGKKHWRLQCSAVYLLQIYVALIGCTSIKLGLWFSGIILP